MLWSRPGLRIWLRILLPRTRRCQCLSRRAASLSRAVSSSMSSTPPRRALAGSIRALPLLRRNRHLAFLQRRRIILRQNIEAYLPDIVHRLQVTL